MRRRVLQTSTKKTGQKRSADGSLIASDPKEPNEQSVQSCSGDDDPLVHDNSNIQMDIPTTSGTSQLIIEPVEPEASFSGEEHLADEQNGKQGVITVH